MKAVLDTKPESAYDDEIASRYHFPPRYLALVRKCVGDGVVFRRPHAGGEDIAYFAVGRVIGVAPDPLIAGFHYASIGDFLMFDRPVAWRIDGRYAEAALRAIENVPEVELYLRGKSVRELDEAHFAAIVDVGLSDMLDPENAEMLGLDTTNMDSDTWDILHSPGMNERRTASIHLNRKIREASFKRAVYQAYGNQCAATGVRIVNAGGRSEVQAAHILPVALGGPDIVQNGIALSTTVHWLLTGAFADIDYDENRTTGIGFG